MKLETKSLFSVLIAISFLFSSCSTINRAEEPSDAQINAEAAKAYAEVKAKSKISRDPTWNAIVDRVAKRIEIASGEKDFQWEVVVIESPEVNAWCMPGGKIAVYTGILPVLKTEGALAAVLGHEVTHAVRRHGKQQYARSINENFVGLLVGGATVLGGQFLCHSTSCKLLTGLGGAAAGFAITFFDLKFSRGDETEADQYGQIYMAKAGYDPAEAVKLWDRMAAANQNGAPPEFLSNHPSDANRKQNLTKWLPQAEAIYANSPDKLGTGVNLPTQIAH